MDNADAQALSRLYQFSVDVHVFKDLSQSLEQHIDVSDQRSGGTQSASLTLSTS
jgi:hypothetical protein